MLAAHHLLLQFLLTRLLRGATLLLLLLRLILQFLLTRLLRGATLMGVPLPPVLVNFYSHASCEARQILYYILTNNANFYSHASCEARPNYAHMSKIAVKFLLTRLLRGATFFIVIFKSVNTISTHTPLARRDPHRKQISISLWNFYSHASCEARHRGYLRLEKSADISTHTPLARRDSYI